MTSRAGNAPPRRGDEADPGLPQTADNTCRLCGGSGRVDNNGASVRCPECGGSGRVTETVGDA